MRDVLPDLLRWWRVEEDTALASVIRTWRSAPRPPGTAMLVGPDGSVVGSVSGGCIDSEVYTVAEQVLADGCPVLRSYGVSDDDAFTVGLTCGGVIDIFVQQVNRSTYPELEQVASAIADQRPVAVATVIRHPNPDRVGRRLVLEDGHTIGTLGNEPLDQAVTSTLAQVLSRGRSCVLTYEPDGRQGGEDVHVFVQSFAPEPRLLVFGANDFAAATARLASFLSYRVTVCDARPTFTTRRRFPTAHDVIVDWPHRYLQTELDAGRIDTTTAICVLTHDPKFDIPLLQTALAMPIACYVGAMGSRRTDQHRRTQLSEHGLSAADLSRLSSPIGLDLGAHTPEETAVSIMAEITARNRSGTGTRLADSNLPIHHQHTVEPARQPSTNPPPRPADL